MEGVSSVDVLGVLKLGIFRKTVIIKEKKAMLTFRKLEKGRA